MSFSAMLAQAASTNSVEILPSWTQGRATFGGLIAALLYQHALTVVGAEQPLRSFTISFVAPVAIGEVSLQTTVLRRGKSVIQVETKMLQNSAVVAMALQSFGLSRESNIIIAPEIAPCFKAPADCLTLPYVPQVTPDFTRHFDLCWAVGTLPFTASTSGTMGGWMRFSNESSDCQVGHLLALADAWPPSVLPMFKTVAPISTLTWTVEFLSNHFQVLGSDWWQYLADADASANGYAHIGAKIWDKNGQLVAISRQTVAVFA